MRVAKRRGYRSYNGRHNRSKLLAFCTLYRCGWLTIRQLQEASELSYEYLAARLTVWFGWGYVLRKPVPGELRPCYSYRLAAKGRGFIESTPERVLSEVLPGEPKSIDYAIEADGLEWLCYRHNGLSLVGLCLPCDPDNPKVMHLENEPDNSRIVTETAFIRYLSRKAGRKVRLVG